MPKVIQDNNTNRSNPDSSSSGPKSFNFVLRRGLKKTKEFLDLFPFLRILFPRRSSTFSYDNSFRNSISRGKHFRLAALFSGFGLVFLFTLTFSPLQSPTSPTEAATGTAQDSTLTLDVTSASAVVDINVVDSAGTFSSSDKTTSDKNSNIAFSITTNNFSGYTLSIAGTDDTGLMNDEEAENSLSSIPTMLTEDAFSNATNTMYNGMWGYKPSKYNSAANTNYYPAPTTEESTLDVTAVPNTTANNYTIALGARTDFTKPSTTYKSSNFIITAVTNPINYSIAYNSNTTDTVNNMPGTQSASTSATSITLSNNTPTREHHTFNGWCSVKPTTTNGDDVCNGGTVYLAGAVYGIDKTTLNDTTLYAMWNIDKFVQTTQVRYENADGTWGSYTTAEQKTVNYGSDYSWSTSQITGFDSTAYKAGSVASYTVTAAKTNQVSIYRQTYECKAQYKLQAADGTYPSTYTTVTVDSALRYGSTCSYTTTQNTAQYTNQTASATVNGATTLTLPNVPRKTYKLTVTAGTNTSSPTGAGTYRWGQTVAVGVTKAANTTCISYAAPTWAKSTGATGTLSATSGTSVTYTMGTTADTITATSTASNVQQTITLSRSNASSISIAGTAYIASSVKLTCGTYNITGAFASGYEFSSWAITGTNNSVASTSTLATTLTVGGAGTLTLTGKASVLTPVTATYMQDVNSCPSTMTTGTVYTLTDSRDNEQYKVARLADGKCWMMENLRLGSTGTMTLTPANTNITSNYTLPASGTANFTDDANGYTKAAINIDSRNKVDANGSKYGTYYNYCAASAGTYCYASGSGTGNATADICPKGWRLPTGGASGEFRALVTAYNISSNAAGSTTLQQTLKFPLAGYFYNGSANAQASSGPYWSSTYSSGTAMYYLGSNASTVNPQLSNDRYGGFLVRCVLETTIFDITYMQDVTPTIVANTAEGATATLTDKRDNKTYTVAKINGNLWMTQNLDLPGGTTLTSSDSNVSSNYTLPASSTSGFSDSATAYVYNSNSTTCSSSSPCYSYYSYVAATAGTNPSSGAATSDICPKGWRLPTQAEMQTMANSYTTGATMTASPFLGVYAGRYNNSSFYNGGSGGYYWSSTANSSSLAYYLYFNSSTSNVDDYLKRYGFSVRCVAKS